MYLKRESSYISGLVNMASSCSKQIGLSYVEADCFAIRDYKIEFEKTYKFKEKLVLEELNQTFEELLKDIFGDDKKLIEGLIHWIELTAGKANKVLTVNKSIIERLSNIPFYFLEDLFIIECEKMVICLLIGNDE